MHDERKTRVTEILSRVTDEGDSALRQLMPLIYDELRALAASYLKNERPNHTLQATALAHEAFIRLVDQEAVQWRNRAHFMAVASQAIRRILVDHARGHLRAKRGGGRHRISLDENLAWTGTSELDVIALDDAMAKLTRLHERQARIVELRFFGDLPLKEIAEVLGVSLRTVEGDWAMARAWLKRELSGATGS